jgi:ribosomal protein S18 acetylase RimI-like enzyme
MKLRLLKEVDVLSIQKLALKSWLFTYRKIYSKKSIRKQVADYYSDKNLQDTLLKIHQKKEYFIVAQDKSIVGYAHVGKTKGVWELLRIYVDPDLIGRGIGKKLLNKVELFLKSKNARKYIAHPHISNPIAINFYIKNGFYHHLKGDRGKTSPCYVKNIAASKR